MTRRTKFEAERSIPVWDDADWAPPAHSLGRHEAHDAVIVGGGFTGLWTALHLTELDPSLSIVVVDAHRPGFGASGRNGGWCSALFAAELPDMAERHGFDAAIAMQRAMFSTVDDIGEFISRSGIECGWVKSGTLTSATSTAHLQRLQSSIETYRRFGFDESDMMMLDSDEALARVNAKGTLAATFTPHCATINPQQLVAGLVDVLTRRGVKIVSDARVDTVEPRRVMGQDGNGSFVLETRWTVRATEAYGSQMSQYRRDLVPIYSYMVATEKLPHEVWNDVGWAKRETFADFRHMIIYAQRTSDDRIAFGGRGIGYRYASRITADFETIDAVHSRIVATMHRLFPSTRDCVITHRWGGPLAIPRDWHPAVVCDHENRVAHAGGYVGDGVASSHLAGRTIAEIITGHESALCRLPWVGHISPKWEREPLRWIGLNSMSRMARVADAVERVSKRPARRIQRLMDWVVR